MFPHIAQPFTLTGPIAVHTYTNELFKYVVGLVPNIQTEQLKTIRNVFQNIKTSHEYHTTKAATDETTRALLIYRTFGERERELQSLRTTFSKIAQELRSSEVENAKLKKDITTKNRQIENLKKRFAESETKFREAKTELESAEDAVKDLKEELRSVKTDRFMLNVEVKHYKKVAECELRKSHLLECEWQELKIDYHCLMQSFNSPYSKEDVIKHLEKINKYIEEGERRSDSQLNQEVKDINQRDGNQLEIDSQCIDGTDQRLEI